MLVHMVKILVPYLCRIGKQNNQFKPAIAIHNMGGGFAFNLLKKHLIIIYRVSS